MKFNERRYTDVEFNKTDGSLTIVAIHFEPVEAKESGVEKLAVNEVELSEFRRVYPLNRVLSSSSVVPCPKLAMNKVLLLVVVVLAGAGGAITAGEVSCGNADMGIAAVAAAPGECRAAAVCPVPAAMEWFWASWAAASNWAVVAAVAWLAAWLVDIAPRLA